jgi:hypothetical protein
MGKILKGVLLGGVVGAGIAGVQSLRRDDPTDQVLERAAKAGAEAAVVGGIVALVLDRRARRKVRRLTVAEALRERTFTAAALAARPVVEHALEVARDRAERAAEAAKPKVEHAAEVARERAVAAAEAAKPRVEHAAEVARERARPAVERMADAAKPRVEHATEVARERASAAAEAARERLAESRNGDGRVVVKVA